MDLLADKVDLEDLVNGVNIVVNVAICAAIPEFH